jgi:hypothetical protein
VFASLMRNIGRGQAAAAAGAADRERCSSRCRGCGRSRESHCEVAQSLADALGCGLRVREALGHSFERWDGKGASRKQGEAIPIAMRVVQVADEAQRFHRAAGIEGAMAMLGLRAGRALDPALAAALRADPAALFASLDVPSIWDAAIAAEPGAPDYIADDRLDGALQAMGAFADLKSSYTRGHSVGVAELAAGAAERLGLPAGVIEEVRRAGYVHDVGRAGVSAACGRRKGRSPTVNGRRCGCTRTTRSGSWARPAAAGAAGDAGALDPRAPGRQRLPHRLAGRVAAPGARPAGGGRHVPGDARDAPPPARDFARGDRGDAGEGSREGAAGSRRPCAPCWRRPPSRSSAGARAVPATAATTRAG